MGRQIAKYIAAIVMLSSLPAVILSGGLVVLGVPLFWYYDVSPPVSWPRATLFAVASFFVLAFSRLTLGRLCRPAASEPQSDRQ